MMKSVIFFFLAALIAFAGTDQVVAQWQLVNGELKRVVVWPADVAAAAPLFPYK